MIKLHLGCGKRNFGKDWIHIDGEKHDHVSDNDIINIEYKDVDVIYASHVLEYFDANEADIVLCKWRDALKSGGILRLAVPDFEAMSKLYVSGEYKLESFLGPIYGKMKMDGNFIYHKTTYDFDTIKSKLEKLGFKNIKRYDWRETEHFSIDDCSQAHLPHMDKEHGTLISLNVECKK